MLFLYIARIVFLELCIAHCHTCSCSAAIYLRALRRRGQMVMEWRGIAVWDGVVAGPTGTHTYGGNERTGHVESKVKGHRQIASSSLRFKRMTKQHV